MPLLAGLLLGLLGNVYRLAFLMFGAQWAIRITAASTIAALYVGCAVTFTVMLGPWLASWASTGFGMLLGLLFPPIAGSVLASLAVFWTCILAKRHTKRLIQMTVSGHS